MGGVEVEWAVFCKDCCVKIGQFQTDKANRQGKQTDELTDC